MHAPNTQGNTVYHPTVSPKSQPKNKLATAGLTLGILGLLTSWLLVGLLACIPGVITSILGLYHSRARGLKKRAITGLVLSMVGIVISIPLIVNGVQSQIQYQDEPHYQFNGQQLDQQATQQAQFEAQQATQVAAQQTQTAVQQQAQFEAQYINIKPSRSVTNNPYITGKIVVIDLDQKKRAYTSNSSYPALNAIIANMPDEVGTIIRLHYHASAVVTYLSGATGYQVTCYVTIIDKKKI